MSERALPGEKDLIKIEQAEGDRFVVSLSYGFDVQGVGNKSDYKEFSPESLVAGRDTPNEEDSFFGAPLIGHKTLSLGIRDKRTQNLVDVLDILPTGWRILAVELPNTNPGQDGNLTKRFPFMISLDNKAIALPVYKLRDQRVTDEAAVGIIYNVGVSRGLMNKGVATNSDASRVGREFLIDTLGRSS